MTRGSRRIGLVSPWLTSAAVVGLAVVSISAPLVGQLPPVEAPDSNLVTLGRLLFWDPVLSGEQDVACATCHHPDFAYADGRELSLGPRAVGLGPERQDLSDGLIPVVKRNSQSVLNTVYNALARRRGRRGRGTTELQASARMFWDNRVQGLEAQALEPIKAFEEMRGLAYPAEHAIDSVVARLRAIPEYTRLFANAFHEEEIQSESVARALGDFQRSLLAVDSRFDRFQAGDTSALTVQEIRGMRAFDAVGCDRCHTGPMFSDFQLHAEGVVEHPLLASPDTSRGRFRFRTPSLRNVALTAPYMHNGMLASLEDVMQFYNEGRSRNPNVADGGRRRGNGGTPSVDRDFRRVANMTPQQMEDIIAFLRALTDDDYDRMIPARVPSGLPPGGHISNEGTQ